MKDITQQIKFQNLRVGPDQTNHYPPPDPPIGRKSDVFNRVKSTEIDRRATELREELAAATVDNDVHRLESAVRAFRAGHVQDQDALNKAYTRLYDLHHNAVDSTRNDEEKLAAALKDVDISQVAYMLRQSNWLQQAQNALRRMRRLASVKHEVQSLSGRQQVSEVQAYNHPHAGVRAAIVATYILLGEKQGKLKKWKRVQSLLRCHGNQSILQRIQKCDVSAIDTKLAEEASLLLSTCNLEEIRSLSVSAAAFYNWSKAVVELAEKDDNVSCIQHEEVDEGEMAETPDIEEEETGQETNG